jgi:hypothetical protein
LLGIGMTTSQSIPIGIAGISDATAVSVGTLYACALRETGEVACWGAGAEGQLGNGFATSQTTPAPVSDLTDAVSIAAGPRHACAARQTGEVVCLGHPPSVNVGESGDVSAIPLAISGLTDAIAVSVSNERSCALRSTGEIVCWRGYAGTQEPLADLTDGEALSVGDRACALRATGQLLCDSVTVPDLDDATRVGAGDGSGTGDDHVCAVRETGQVACWGNNGSGQLGYHTFSTVPVVVIP